MYKIFLNNFVNKNFWLVKVVFWGFYVKNKKYFYKCVLLDYFLCWLKEMNIFYGINYYYIRKVLLFIIWECKWYK